LPACHSCLTLQRATYHHTTLHALPAHTWPHTHRTRAAPPPRTTTAAPFTWRLAPARLPTVRQRKHLAFCYCHGRFGLHSRCHDARTLYSWFVGLYLTTATGWLCGGERHCATAFLSTGRRAQRLLTHLAPVLFQPPPCILALHSIPSTYLFSWRLTTIFLVRIASSAGLLGANGNATRLASIWRSRRAGRTATRLRGFGGGRPRGHSR